MSTPGRTIIIPSAAGLTAKPALSKRRHFMICDDRAYRLEKPHDDNAFKNNLIRATANFNDIDRVPDLYNTFSLLCMDSKIININKC